MAKDLTVVCGPYLLPWDIFIFMSSIVEGCRLEGLRHDLAYTFGINDEPYSGDFARAARTLRFDAKENEILSVSLERRRSAYKHGSELSMLTAISWSRNQKSIDARDKVYSVLAFSSLQQQTEDGLKIIVPDYTISAHELFIDIGKSFMLAYGPRALSLSGKSELRQTKGLPSWVPDLNSPLFVRPLGIDIDETHDATVHAPGIESNAAEGFLQTSTLHITPQNELFVSAYILDAISDLAILGLKDVGDDLNGLNKWLELLSVLDVPPKERQRVLWRTMIEDSTAIGTNEPLPLGLSDVDFKDWLIFVCIISVLGHTEYLQGSVLSAAEYDMYYHERVDRSQAQIQKMLDQTLAAFAVLTISCSSAEEMEWGNASSYSSSNEHSNALLGVMASNAMEYGNIIRNNDPSRRLLRSKSLKMLGTGPQEALAGDAICIIEGASIPYVLRPRTDGTFQYIGEAYLYGTNTEELLRTAHNEGKLKPTYIK